jgi:hypothetical protein
MSPSRGPSLATADANENIDDVVCIPAPWDAEALEAIPSWNRTTLTPFSCSTTLLLLLLLSLFFPAMYYCITTVVYISYLTSQCGGKGALGSSRYIGPWGIFRDYISTSTPCM